MKRKRLGLVFAYDESWIAGTYYILNLIHALKLLPDAQKPELVILCDNSKDRLIIESINYPYISYRAYIPQYSFFEVAVNKISRLFSGKNIFEKRINNNDVDFILLQRRSWETDLLNNEKKIFWIADFQVLNFPDTFSERELNGRIHVHHEIINSNSKIVFSSQAVKNDFQKFYPKATNKIFIVNFSVTLPQYKHLDILQLREKYKIKGNYFIAPNQFWQHKNHIVILKAALKLKEKGIAVTIVFTGKENDFRAPEYTIQLKEFVTQNELQNQVLFLGFIDRAEQLCLIKNSLAVIQPSLFEGWSTVVEDAKALGKYLVLSDIEIHREQIQENVTFFEPHNDEELANILVEIANETSPIIDIDYAKSQLRFGLQFMEAIRN